MLLDMHLLYSAKCYAYLGKYYSNKLLITNKFDLIVENFSSFVTADKKTTFLAELFVKIFDYKIINLKEILLFFTELFEFNVIFYKYCII